MGQRISVRFFSDLIQLKYQHQGILVFQMYIALRVAQANTSEILYLDIMSSLLDMKYNYI